MVTGGRLQRTRSRAQRSFTSATNWWREGILRPYLYGSELSPVKAETISLVESHARYSHRFEPPK